MAILIKSIEEIEIMKKAGSLTAKIFETVRPFVTPGVSTEKLNQICHQAHLDLNVIPAPLNYRGFPKSICTSVNQVVCHGIPNANEILKDGDIINIDVTLIYEGYHADTSQMFFVGSINPKAFDLVKTTYECLQLGMSVVKDGAYLGDIGFVIAQHAKAKNYSIVKEYCGHGIGKIFHEDPQILHYGNPKTGMKIKKGMCFTIEPMLNIGKASTKVLSDKWTVVTKDSSLSSQWEHTICVTEYGYETLTTWDIDPKSYYGF